MGKGNKLPQERGVEQDINFKFPSEEVELYYGMRREIVKQLKESFLFSVPDTVQTTKQLKEIIQQQAGELKEGRVRVLSREGEKNFEEIQRIINSKNMVSEIENILTLAPEDQKRLEKLTSEKLNEEIQNYKTKYLSPYILEKYQEEEYAISHIDTLLQERKISKKQYQQILVILGKTTADDKINLARLAELISNYDINLTTLNKFSIVAIRNMIDKVPLDRVARITNTRVYQQINMLYEFWYRLNVEKLNTLLSSSCGDNFINLLEMVDLSRDADIAVVIELMYATNATDMSKIISTLGDNILAFYNIIITNKEKFFKLLEKYIKNKKLDEFLTLIKDKRRLPRW